MVEKNKSRSKKPKIKLSRKVWVRIIILAIIAILAVVIPLFLK